MSSARLKQSEINECGLVAVAIAAEYLGAQHRLPELRSQFPLSSRGTSLTEIAEIAEQLSLRASLLSYPTDRASEIHIPAILHWRTGHYVVLLGVKRGRFRIHDPMAGVREIDRAELERGFSGAVVELRRAASFRRIRRQTQFKVQQLFSLDGAVANGLAQALLLTAVMQAHILIGPLYIRVVLDDILVGLRDASIMITAGGFAALAAFNLVAEILRTTVLIRLAGTISLDATSRAFTHLLSLPLAWFQRRRLADVISRFDAIEPINSTITNGVVTAGFDVLIALTTFAFMLAVSPALTLAALVSLCVYATLRLATLPLTLRLDAESWAASVAEQGARIETLRTIQTIKGIGGEASRLRLWRSTFADRVLRTQASRFWQGAIQSAQTSLQTLTYIALVVIAVGQIWSNHMTTGTLFAFLAYGTQFALRGKSIVDQAVQVRLLGLYAERISEVVESEPEQTRDRDLIRRRLKGALTGEGVTFQYGAGDPLVLERANFSVEPGETVGIVGPSGGGKSTLLKIMAGLYIPRVGTLSVDGDPVYKWDYQYLRKQIGMVLQGDDLFAGSIQDNITLFDPEPDAELIDQCLDTASLSGDIAGLPMGVHTQVGDLGSNLSGGQKQRVLIARAVYNDPAIIILDEATSNLDVVTEQQIIRKLIGRKRTLIIVSHRPETMRYVNRVITVQNGRVTSETLNSAHHTFG